MARVTVEDCIEKISNRFELIIAASQRAREISNGVKIEVDRDNDKNPVVSLREIANGSVTPADLHERFIKSLQKNIINENVDDEEQSSVQDEFAAYINEATLTSSSDSSQTNIANNKLQDDVFEDVSEDIVRNED